MSFKRTISVGRRNRVVVDSVDKIVSESGGSVTFSEAVVAGLEMWVERRA